MSSNYYQRKKLIGRSGRKLESWLDEVVQEINNLGFHAHKNNPRRTHNGMYLEGEPFDYEFFLDSGIHVFDAKENMSGGDFWNIHYTGALSRSGNAKLIRQAQNLTACAKAGAQAYFLVYFGSEYSEVSGKLIRFDADIILEELLKKSKKVPYTMGKIWDLGKLLA